MARIDGVSEATAPPEVRETLQRQRERYGSVLNSTRVTGLRPTILKGAEALAEGIRASGLLAPPLRYLATYRTALINGCPF